MTACSFTELGTALLCVATGLAVAFLGARARQKLLVVLGGVGLVVGAACVAIATLRIETLTHWASLTLIGVVLIFAASVLDRAREHVLGRLSQLRVTLREWRY